MNSRHLTARFAQRVSKAVTVAALAVGLTATVFAPTSALAAPITIDRGPSNSPDQVAAMFETAVPQVPHYMFKVKNFGGTTAKQVKIVKVATLRYSSNDQFALIQSQEFTQVAISPGKAADSGIR